MKQTILNLMKKIPIGDRWCITIDDCIDPKSNLGQRGQVNIAIAFDDDEYCARERCYNKFVDAMINYNIRTELIPCGKIIEVSELK